ncbi:unnamed protein product [Merluccius merluccius]
MTSVGDYRKTSSEKVTELDLNGGGERGDREGKEKEQVEESKVNTHTEDHRKQTACWDKTKKDRTFGLPAWCNVWHRTLWCWGAVMVTMVTGGRYVCSAHAREEEPANAREERILAVLGIIGTILNLLVVIFVYIYTSVT